MSLPRLVVSSLQAPCEGGVLELGPEHARHLSALRLRPGCALELLLPAGPWRADLASCERSSASVRLVGPLADSREAAFPLEACLPLTAQLSLWDDWLPPLVELGVTCFQPVVYARSEFDARKTLHRMDRWRRIILGAVEQSHRSVLPSLAEPCAFERLLEWPCAQKWVAYEGTPGGANPALEPAPLAFTSGPEGGFEDGEILSLTRAGWRSVSLGRAILRAVTAPVALAGAVRFSDAAWPT